MEKDTSESTQDLFRLLREQVNKDQATLKRLGESTEDLLDQFRKGNVSSQEVQVALLSHI